MPLVPANQSQLIRSSQKDEYYQTFLRNSANDAFQTFAGEFGHALRLNNCAMSRRYAPGRPPRWGGEVLLLVLNL